MSFEHMLQSESTVELGYRVEEAILEENFPAILNPLYWMEMASTFADAIFDKTMDAVLKGGARW